MRGAGIAGQRLADHCGFNSRNKRPLLGLYCAFFHNLYKSAAQILSARTEFPQAREGLIATSMPMHNNSLYIPSIPPIPVTNLASR
jgi:hypothetical protein